MESAVPLDAAASAELAAQGIEVQRPLANQRYLVRMRYTPYWEVHGGVAACVSPGPDGMTEVRTPAAGLIELGLVPSMETVGDAVTGTSSGCRGAAS